MVRIAVCVCAAQECGADIDFHCSQEAERSSLHQFFINFWSDFEVHGVHRPVECVTTLNTMYLFFQSPGCVDVSVVHYIA